VSGRRRAWWLKTLHQWHWISSALCLAGMLLFAITGITLNHAAQIESKAAVASATAQLPAELQATLAALQEGPLPREIRNFLANDLDMPIDARDAEWSDDEIYLALPRPGGDGWIAIDRATGAVEAESSDRGWISYFNDLHKGRNAGAGWGWFLDVFALACVVFCVTGFVLLQMHARQRAMTWPMVGAGLLIPCLIALLLIH
jgi:hypothetical protein